MISVYTLTFYRTVLAILAAVMGYLAMESCFTFPDKFLGYGQFPALGTEIGILIRLYRRYIWVPNRNG